MSEINGIILIDKPKFVTSHDVVNRVRRLLNTKRVGHTGTLDPIATGVLPICVGNATKASDMLICDEKEYTAELVFGKTTDTGDCEGKVLTECAYEADYDTVKDVIMSFVGQSEQIPPMYSAKKQNGKKLYELARAGVTVERKPVPITIKNISVLDIDKATASFNVCCSKGTYIRTLCEDIGAKLGCGAYMNSLKRTRSGFFDISKCVTLEELEKIIEIGKINAVVIPTDRLFNNESVFLSEIQSSRFRNGVFVSHKNIQDGKIYKVYDFRDNFLALAECTDGRLKIKKSFMS